MQVMYLGGPIDGAVGSLNKGLKRIRYTVDDDPTVHEYRLEGEPTNEDGVLIAAFMYLGVVHSAPTLTLKWED